MPDSSGRVLTLTFDANNAARDTVTLFSPRPGFLHQVRFIEDGVTVSGSAVPNGTATAKVPSGPQTGIKISPADGVPFELQREKSTRIEVLIDVGHQVNRPGKSEFHFKPALSATLVEAARSPAILPDRVVVRFHDGVTLLRINELIAEGGSTVLNSDRSSNYYVLKIPSTGSLEAALEFYTQTSVNNTNACP